ncbi:hypothetical protein Bca52824_074905 [Brassica carinata]|uniref:Uncharacterized protein n=1 Tax=Brassica carinata TaxID=52824 RepID=A0A8X7PPC5_BRACI|nr:hypothetical protein Bca52824_074905 [Brassica carinata]
MDVRMSKFEKNQRQLRRRAKKIEEKLTSIESNKNEERNYGEDMDFGWDDRDYGRAEGKENSEKAKEDKENKGVRRGKGCGLGGKTNPRELLLYRVIVITPRRTKAADARKAISISPEIVVVTGIAELAEKEVESSEKHAELAEKSVESDVDLDVEEEEEKAEEIKDNLVESPAKKQTELAEKSVEVELKTKRKPKVKVIECRMAFPELRD